MNAIVFQVLTVLVSAGVPAAAENPLLTEIVTKGVTMPDGQVFALQAPKMTEGLTEEQQMAVLTDVSPHHKVEFLLDKNNTMSGAPVSLRIKSPTSKQGDGLIRIIDAYFVVYGDWNVLTSEKFSDSILKKDSAKANNIGETAILKAGYLTPPELANRRLATRSTSVLREYFLYTTLKLFDEVEVSATRHAVATKTPAGVVVAAIVDPRFAKDKWYPNQWQPITRNVVGVPELGPPLPYSGAGFYAKVTRLIKPENAVFVEYHSTFFEPDGWFGNGNGNRLHSELRKIVPFKVKDFRIKLNQASESAKEGVAKK
ncbi:MAG: hypothetical protein ACLP9L_08935 [Thermoguttaceae bacterium]